jgi:hypothetical protein
MIFNLNERLLSMREESLQIGKGQRYRALRKQIEA